MAPESGVEEDASWLLPGSEAVGLKGGDSLERTEESGDSSSPLEVALRGGGRGPNTTLLAIR
jgi:hypothetical protein